MPTITVSSGVTSTGLVISGGTVLDVLSGGTAVSTTLLSGGVLSVLSGGYDSGTTVSSGGTLIADQTGTGAYGANAVADLVLNGGTEIAVTQGWVQNATIHGSLIISSGGFAQLDMAEAGGVVTVSAGGSANIVTVSSGGSLTILSGGAGLQTKVSSGGVERVLGIDHYGTVLAGGTEFVSSGGTTEATVVNAGGTEIVLPGGTAIVSSGQTDYGLTASGGTIIVSSGGITSGVTLLGGGVETVSSGATAGAATIGAGGVLSVLANGYDNGATVSSGGTLIADQTGAGGYGANAVADLVLNGGTEIAVTHGWVQNATIQGSLIISSGGFAQLDTAEAGGVVTLSAGGSANITIVSSGAVERVLGIDQYGTVLAGGTEIVSSGGFAEGTVVSSGGQESVLASGTAIVFSGQMEYGLTASGGAILVSSGGATRAAEVLAGGDQIVSSGGSALVPTIGSGGTLDLAAGAVVSGEILFAGANAALMIGDVAPPTAPIGGFVSAGDTLDLTQMLFYGNTSVGFDSATDALTVVEGGISATVQLTTGNYAGVTWTAKVDGGGGTQIVACFLPGTRIATPKGDVPVESLRTGDHVRLAGGGTAPVVWLGHRRVDCGRHPRPWDAYPVRVRAGAFGPGRPAADLLLSPDHAVYLEQAGVLVPVRYLLNGATIVQEDVARVTYWHVELPSHGVLLAEGLPCESYLDTGNRAAFANSGKVVQATPDFARSVWAAQGCAPLVCDGAVLVEARRCLLARAMERGHALTAEPDLHLRADGRVVRPVSVAAGRYRFALRRPAKIVRLCSRAGVPAEINAAGSDPRRLGVMVTRLAVHGGGDWQEIALDAFPEANGWHRLERDDTAIWRWTDGNARVPLTAVGDALMLDVEVAMAMPAWRRNERAGGARIRKASWDNRKFRVREDGCTRSGHGSGETFAE